MFFVVKQKTAYELRISDWSSDVCSSDLHERFIPEVARRLADPMFTKDLHISKYALSEFVRRQERLLVDICNSLDDDSKAALAMIYMRNGRLESPIQMTESENTALERMNSDLGRITLALQAIVGSLVVHFPINPVAFWPYN